MKTDPKRVYKDAADHIKITQTIHNSDTNNNDTETNEQNATASTTVNSHKSIILNGTSIIIQDQCSDTIIIVIRQITLFKSTFKMQTPCKDPYLEVLSDNRFNSPIILKSTDRSHKP